MKAASLSHSEIEVQNSLKKHYDVFFSRMYKKIKSIFQEIYSVFFSISYMHLQYTLKCYLVHFVNTAKIFFFIKSVYFFFIMSFLISCFQCHL